MYMTREVATLNLISELTVANGGFALDTTNNANILYQVDFDSLFNGRDKLYSKCQVRGSLVSNGRGSGDLSDSTGFVILVGLGSNNSLGINGIHIVTTYPINKQEAGLSQFVGYSYATSTLMNPSGSQVSPIPSGIRQFRIQLYDPIQELLFNANMPNYSLILQFELYDPVE